MNKADELRRQIAELQRELAVIEQGIYEVYPGDTISKLEGKCKLIKLHMNPITYVEFCKDKIEFWGGSEVFSMNIIPQDTNQEFSIEVVGDHT